MRQEVYRVAYDEAHAELLEISTRYEELRRRKETLESAVTALAPVLGVALPAQAVQPASQPAPSVPQNMAEPASYGFNEVPAVQHNSDESSTDPFQQRVRNALKFSSNNNGHEHRGLQPAV